MFSLNRGPRYIHFLFILLVSLLFCGGLSGCATWKTPFFGKKHTKKDLPDAPLFDGTSNNDLVAHAEVLRKSKENSDKSEQENEKKTESKKWYQKNWFMSNKAADIDRHLGE